MVRSMPWSLARDGGTLHVHLEAPMTSPEWNGVLRAVRDSLSDAPHAATLPAEVEGFGPADAELLASLWESLATAGVTIQRE